MIEDKPMSAEERIVKYTEFAAAFGPDLNLDMHGQQLDFLQYHCLDIILPIVLLMSLVFYYAFKSIRLLFRTISMFVNKSKSKNE